MKCDQYIIKPNEKLIVGVLQKYKLKGVLGEMIDTYGAISPLTLAILKLLDGNDVITGFNGAYKAVAKCQEGDEFSEKTGKNIVDLKVSYKYHDAMIRKYNYLERKLKKLLNKVCELRREHVAYRDMFDEKLKSYM